MKHHKSLWPNLWTSFVRKGILFLFFGSCQKNLVEISNFFIVENSIETDYHKRNHLPFNFPLLRCFSCCHLLSRLRNKPVLSTLGNAWKLFWQKSLKQNRSILIRGFTSSFDIEESAHTSWVWSERWIVIGVLRLSSANNEVCSHCKNR